MTTSKKWVPVGRSPEGRTYFQEVKAPTLKKGETPPLPEGPVPINPATGEAATILQTQLPEPKPKKKTH